MIGTVATRGIAMIETGSTKTIRGIGITTTEGTIGTATTTGIMITITGNQ
jgi:hypothetical protein